MSAGEWFFVIVVVALLGGLLVWVFRYSNWINDPEDHFEPEGPPPTTARPHVPPPQPTAGWEWQGLVARDALSLIAPDQEGTYSVRINDDNSFSVHRDPA